MKQAMASPERANTSRNLQTSDPNFTIRHANPDDAACVVAYMQKLGVYQRMANEITATESQIRRLLAEDLGEALFGCYDGEIVGFVYYCRKSSAFTGRSGLYIDGFLIDEDMRHKGLGTIMIGYLCRLALDREDTFLEWGCLDWNAPTIQFYRKLGAYSLDEMTIFRFKPEQLHANAQLFEQTG
jgi:GNAT superfamily N-acetyltransferase